MKNKIFYTVLLITASVLFEGHTSYGSDRGRASLPKQDQEIIEDALTKDEGTGKRVQKRAEARDLQKKGEQFKKDVKTVTKPLSSAGTTVGIVASASGDPHAKMGAAAFKLSISAIEGLGKGIAQIVIGVGRYQERSQQIFSNIEILLEDLQKSIDKKNSLEKKLQALLTIEKSPEPSQSSSRLKRLATSASNAAKNAEIKVRQAADVLTNEKSKREEKIKVIQGDLKEENDNYNETLRLLQILLMQDTLNVMDKKINIEDTIDRLNSDSNFYKEARENLSKSKSKRKKQLTEIEKKEAQTNRDLIYYLKFQKSPTETAQELEKSRSELINKIKELTQLTKRGDTLYLQQREVQLDSEVNRAAIVALYREIDTLKSQLAVLSKTPSTKAVTDPEPLKKEASQREALPQKASGKAETTRGSFSKEDLIKQKEALRPLNTGK